jgi:hypothetical protein
MENLMEYPLAVFVLSLAVLWVASRLGVFLIEKRPPLEEDMRHDLGVVLTATLTLLGLIIGFTFSMAVSRYDQRKNLEEAEANAIGTEYVRADLMPAAEAAKVRALLKEYVDQRVLYYQTRDGEQVKKIDARTVQLQNQLWSVVAGFAAEKRDPVSALVVAGMNDVLNSQGYTQAAWWNRIPIAAWCLMAAIAIGCNVLSGYGAQNLKKGGSLRLILPVVFSTAFFLIADIDSPRGGVIRVSAQNLLALADSLKAP